MFLALKLNCIITSIYSFTVTHAYVVYQGIYHVLQRVVQVKKTEEDENVDEEVLEEELIALSQGLCVLFVIVT